MTASSFNPSADFSSEELALKDKALLALIKWAPRLVEHAAQGAAYLAASRSLESLESIYTQAQQTDAQELEKLFGKAIEIKKSKNEQFKKFFSNLKNKSTLGKGACMFHGFILALRQRHVLDALDRRAEAGHLHRFIEIMGNQFEIQKNWKAVKEKLGQLNESSAQTKIAPLLRQINIDLLKKKIERSDLHDPKALDLALICALDAYWNNQGDPNSSLYTEKNINIDAGNQLLRKQFDVLLNVIKATRGRGHSECDQETLNNRYAISEALIEWWHQNDEANQLAYLNEARAAEHDERLCWAFEQYVMEYFKRNFSSKKLFQRYCKENSIKEDEFRNFDDSYKTYAFIEIKFAELIAGVASNWDDDKTCYENFATAKKTLLAWWHANNHQPYFKFLDAMAQQSAYGGELEALTLAQYFGVSVIIYAPHIKIESPYCINEDPDDPTRPWIALRHEGWAHWTTYLGPCFLEESAKPVERQVAVPSATPLVTAATGRASPSPLASVASAAGSSTLSLPPSSVGSDNEEDQMPDSSFVLPLSNDLPQAMPLGDGALAMVPTTPAIPTSPRQNKFVRWAAAGGITTSSIAVGVGIGLALMFAVGFPWLALPIAAAIGLGVGIAAAVIYWRNTREKGSGGGAASQVTSGSTAQLLKALPSQGPAPQPEPAAQPQPDYSSLTASSTRLYPRPFALLTAEDQPDQNQATVTVSTV
jgi:hypothetical protein